MRSILGRTIRSIVVVSGLIAFTTSHSLGQTYTFTTLNAPNASVTEAYGINNTGQIVGYDIDLGTNDFLYSNGAFSTIAPPGGTSSIAYGINDAGQIVGIFGAGADGFLTGGSFLDNGGSFSTIAPPGSVSSEAIGINNAGQIVGTLLNGMGTYAFLDTGGSFATFTPPGGLNTLASGINNAGQIVGYFEDSMGNMHGFLDTAGSLTTIDAPGASGYTLANGINDAGTIVGETYISGEGYQGFIDNAGDFTAFNVPGAALTDPLGINNSGQIVGYFQDTGQAPEGFLATPTTGGDLPTSSACAAAIADAVIPSTGGAIFSATGQPISISATFTPLTGSLSAAETDCGVAEFDWQQTVTNYPPPSPFPLTAPFLDPQPGGYGSGNYYAYCNRSITTHLLSATTISFSDPSVAFGSAYPFYYEPYGPAGDCFSESTHENFGTTLSFFDLPSDYLLQPSQFEGFTTCLVGVDALGNPVPLPTEYDDCFKWTDTYTGLGLSPAGCTTDCTIDALGQGGIPWFQLDSDLSAGISGEGDGGITIVEFAATVPEPPTILLFGLGLMVLFRCRHAWPSSIKFHRT